MNNGNSSDITYYVSKNPKLKCVAFDIITPNLRKNGGLFILKKHLTQQPVNVEISPQI